MSKILIIIALTLILVAGTVGGWLVLRNKNTAVESASTTNSNNSLFPAAAKRPGDDSLPAVLDISAEMDWEGFKRISLDVADLALIKDTGKESLVYSLNTSGNIYQFTTGNETGIRLTNTSFPRTYKTYFGKDTKGLRAIIRSSGADNEILFSGLINKAALASSTVSELGGKALSPSIKEIAINPSADALAALVTTVTGSRLDLTNFDSTKPKQIWLSPLAEWKISWPEKQTLILQSKASAFASGVIYSLNPITSFGRTLVGNLTGLSGILSPNAKGLLFSHTDKDNPDIVSLKLQPSLSTNEILTLPIKTFAEKCAWTSDSSTIFCAVPNKLPLAEYPDDWYRGQITTTDDVWAINGKTGETKKIFEVADREGESFDIAKLVVASDQKHLYLLTKNRALWEVDLSIL